jgi:uncharacterized protein (TIGR03382 family)
MEKLGAFLLAALAYAPAAHALNQSMHHDLALGSCRSAGIPDSFCDRMAVETYNVDRWEFDDLAAHSQIPDGKTTCDAANDSLWREFWLGGQMRQTIGSIVWSPSRSGNDQLAQQLGRALHTLQDDCAHKGMPNPQHAWHSLSDTCQGTTESPDVQPDAITCGQVETDAAVAAFVDALHDVGGELAQLGDVTGDADKHFPTYSDVCGFLGEAKDWDGVDRRWDIYTMRPALAASLVAGLSGADSSQFQRVCADGSDVSAAYSDPDFDTSRGPQSCLKIHAFCFGKADSLAESAPPWEPQPQQANVTTGGCSAAPGAPATGAWLLVLLGFLRRPRRRRSRSSTGSVALRARPEAA